MRKRRKCYVMEAGRANEKETGLSQASIKITHQLAN